MPAPPKLTPDEAKRKIALFLDEGTVEPSFHCQQESMRKRNVTVLDIVNTLKTGAIIRAPEWDGSRIGNTGLRVWTAKVTS